MLSSSSFGKSIDTILRSRLPDPASVEKGLGRQPPALYLPFEEHCDESKYSGLSIARPRIVSDPQKAQGELLLASRNGWWGISMPSPTVTVS